MKTQVIAFLSCLITTGVPVCAPADEPAKAPAFIETGFQVKFSAYDGDVLRGEDFKKFDFFVNLLDFGRRTEVLKLGDSIPHTHWKLVKFEYKMQGEDEVSELTLANSVTHEVIVLPINKKVQVGSAPKSRDQWPERGASVA